MTMTFTGAFDFLSNFYPARVEVGGFCYRNAEAAFQAQKCDDFADRVAFSVRVGLMEEVVWAKVAQNPEISL